MVFNPESVEQLTEAGKALHAFVVGLTDGVDFKDAATAFQMAMQSQTVIDEFKADRAKAAALLLGTAQVEFGKS